MASNLSGTISSLLSLALLTSGGSSSHTWQLGSQGYQVAQIQADLGVLGFDPGPVKGVVTRKLLASADQYVTTFGINKDESLASQLDGTLSAMGTVPKNAQGPLMLAVQDDLKTLRLYHGPLDGHWSSQLSEAVGTFQGKVGVSVTGSLTANTLKEMAHWTAVSVTAQHHWLYQVQSGDTWSTLAWAAHLPVKRFTAANGGGTLKVGKSVLWKAPAPPSRSPGGHSASAPPSPPKPQPSATPSVSTGVLANLNPVADLVLIDPTTSSVEALVASENQTAARVDVSVSGQWALTHPDLVQSLSHLGNEMAISGYSGANLNQLPPWGVTQELKWAVHAIESETGRSPSFLFTEQKPDLTVLKAAQSENLTALWADASVPPGGSVTQTTQSTVSVLLHHSNQAVSLQAPVNWSALFKELAQHHFVFETFGQIWASR